MHLLRGSKLGTRQAVAIGTVSPRLSVPPGVRLPQYVGRAPPDMETVSIRPKVGRELQAMRDACAKAATALAYAGQQD
jgi:hypothetical protein